MIWLRERRLGLVSPGGPTRQQVPGQAVDQTRICEGLRQDRRKK
jgi:hypothetical protein